MVIVCILILSIASCNSWNVNGQSNELNVLQYGAKGDGKTDDTQVSVYIKKNCNVKINWIFFIKSIINFNYQILKFMLLR